MRLIAYLLLSLGIATAIVGGAKLPVKQVEYIQQQNQLSEKITQIDGLLSDENRQELDADRVAALKQDQGSLQQTLKNLDGWPPKSTSERFSDAIPVFCVGVGIAIVGIVLWRTDLHTRRLAATGELNEMDGVDGKNTKETTGSIIADGAEQYPPNNVLEVPGNNGGSRATDYIKSIQPAMQVLVRERGQATLEQLPPAINAVLEEHVTPLVELQDQLIEELGLARAAPVLLCMAQGERLLNRAWSAAADGYLQESTDSISKACGAFEDALSELEGTVQEW